MKKATMVLDEVFNAQYKSGTQFGEVFGMSFQAIKAALINPVKSLRTE